MNTAPVSVAVSADTFQQLVVEESKKRLVLVDFWAEWCGPCKSLTPLLEKLALEYGPRLLLATVDCDREQLVAAQFRVQSLPTVMLVKNGQIVDGFAGAQSEGVIRQLLEKHLPKAEDEWLQAGREALASGDGAAAFSLLKQAHDAAPQRADIQLALADALLRLGRTDDASTLLGQIRLADQDSYYRELQAQLELKQQAANTPEIQALEQQLAASPDDPQLQYQLALQYHQVERHEQALALLLAIVEQDRQFQQGAAQQALLDILRTLPSGDPLAARYRRRLYSLLY